MKRTLLFIALGVLLVACGGPGKAARKFTEATAVGHIEEAKKYATEPTGKLLDLAAQFGSIKIDPDYKFYFVKDSVEGNRAWVTYTTNRDTTPKIMRLYKIDGSWKVDANDKK